MTHATDFFAQLAARSNLSGNSLVEAAKAAGFEAGKAKAFLAEDKIQLVKAMLASLRRSDAVSLATIQQVLEEHLDQEDAPPEGIPSWWQPLAPQPLAPRSLAPQAEQDSVKKEAQAGDQPPQEQDFSSIAALLPEGLDEVSGYLDVWQNDKKSHLEQCISRISAELHIASEDEIAGELGGIADELLFCQRCAEDCRLMLSAQFLELAHSICLEAIKKGVHLNGEELNQFEHGLLRCIDIIWEIRTFVANGGDERQYWQNPVSRENFLAVRVELSAIQTALAAAV